jgi:hypothetical protein
MMPDFPPVGTASQRVFASLPEGMEEQIALLAAKEHLLNSPQLERKFWRPMRKRRLPPDRRPGFIDVRFAHSGKVEVTLCKDKPGNLPHDKKAA